MYIPNGKICDPPCPRSPFFFNEAFVKKPTKDTCCTQQYASRYTYEVLTIDFTSKYYLTHLEAHNGGVWHNIHPPTYLSSEHEDRSYTSSCSYDPFSGGILVVTCRVSARWRIVASSPVHYYFLVLVLLFQSEPCASAGRRGRC